MGDFRFFLQNQHFQKKTTFKDIIIVSNSFESNQALHSVGPDLSLDPDQATTYMTILYLYPNLCYDKVCYRHSVKSVTEK